MNGRPAATTLRKVVTKAAAIVTSVAFLAVGSACDNQRELRGAQANEPRAGHALKFVNEGIESRFDLPVGVAAYATMEDVVANYDVTITGVRPLRIDAGLELLAVRGNFVGRARGGEGVAGHPGYACVRWPPPAWGPTYRAKGLRAFVGDRVGLTLFVRPKDVAAAGTFEFSGLEIEYTVGKNVYSQSIDQSKLILTWRSEEDVKQIPGSCNPDLPRPWFATL